MKTDLRISEGKATLALIGRFDFSSHRTFRVACDAPLAAPEVHTLELDFSGVDYLDSSALGMLLLLRERAQASSKSVSLANCRGVVAQVLEIAHFESLFAMS